MIARAIEVQVGSLASRVTILHIPSDEEIKERCQNLAFAKAKEEAALLNIAENSDDFAALVSLCFDYFNGE